MADDKFNQKSPKHPTTRGAANPIYPWFGGSLGINGLKNIVYANPDKPEESYVEQFNYDASFTIQEASGLTNVLRKQVREYTSKGHSSHVDGNKEESGESNKNSSFKEDVGQQSGKNTYEGSGGVKNSGSHEGSVHNDSEGNTYKIANGDQIMTYAGHVSINYEKDHVIGVNGNDIAIIGGEKAINVEGNVSIQSIAAGMHLYGMANVVANSPGPILIESKTQGVEVKGKANVHVDSQGPILIESPQNIMISCGNSYILMTPSSIIIHATRIDLNP